MRAVWDIGKEATALFDALESAPAGPIFFDAEITEEDATLLAAFIWFEEAEDDEPAPAAEIEGNPEPIVCTDAAAAAADRTCVIVGGVGTREVVGFFTASSYEGGGKIGFEDAFPVPDGPPPPVLLRGVVPAAPLAALNAC